MIKIGKVGFTINAMIYIGFIITFIDKFETNKLVGLVGVYIILLLWLKTMMEK